MKYLTGVCGGTFDHFHKGHKEFLHFVFSKAARVFIGITSDLYVEKEKKNFQYSESISPFLTREKELIIFLKKNNYWNRSKIVAIDNVYGPTLSDELGIQVIFATEDSKIGAEKINQQRVKNGFLSLDICVDSHLIQSCGNVISSSRIRTGEINREGNPYILKKWLLSTLYLNPEVRKECKKPLGKITQEISSSFENVIAVGDITTFSFHSSRVYPIISVVDLFVERKKRFGNLNELLFTGNERRIEVVNPAGSITSSLFEGVIKALELIKEKKQVVILVNGEEDLAVLPIILQSPLGFSIYYGQPGKGMVELLVSENLKKKVFNLVSCL